MPQITAASIRNWVMILLRSAPMAFRIPISLVRSVTVTSMMFMMPMPPTSREMPAMAPSTRDCIRLAFSISSAELLSLLI